MKRLFFGAFCSLIISGAQALPNTLLVNLSYDDALVSQLNNAVGVLASYGVKASFYLVPAYDGAKRYKAQWKALAVQGHELGNHSWFHQCRSDLPGRAWVTPSQDLNTISPSKMAEQVIRASAWLHQLDGQTQRTFTPPCADKYASGKPYFPLLAEHFVAIKGSGLSAKEEIIWTPTAITASQLIANLHALPKSARLLTVVFHGVGGDYLSTDSASHHAFVAHLVAHPEKYTLVTYLEARKRLAAEASQ